MSGRRDTVVADAALTVWRWLSRAYARCTSVEAEAGTCRRLVAERGLGGHVSGSSEHSVPDDVFDDVLTAAKANAPWAFERIYEQLAPAVAGYLRMRGAPDPEETTNEVMLGVFRGLPRFEGDAAGFRSWVFTIAHHRLIDERRRTSARVETTEWVEGRHEPAGGDVELEAVTGLDDVWIRELLEQLTEEQRDVILLRVLADLSVDEVAELLGKRPGAVKMLQRRGLATLRRLLEHQGVTS
jgi:RNA polymerase sigma factor (sigma-70 family)